jgi:hypothetical protein
MSSPHLQIPRDSLMRAAMCVAVGYVATITARHARSTLESDIPASRAAFAANHMPGGIDKISHGNHPTTHSLSSMDVAIWMGVAACAYTLT